MVQRWRSTVEEEPTARAEQGHRQEHDTFRRGWHGYDNYHSCAYTRGADEIEDRRRKRAELGKIPMVCTV